MISGRQRALKRLEQAPVTPIEDQYGASHIHKTTASQQDVVTSDSDGELSASARLAADLKQSKKVQ